MSFTLDQVGDYMKLKYLLIGFLLFILLYMFDSFSILSLPNDLAGNWELKIGDETSIVEVPFYSRVNEYTRATFSKSFSLEKADCIILPGVSAGGFRIYLNDQFIGESGDMENATGIFWNYVHRFEFDPGFLKNQNDLRIEIVSLYDFGLHGTPIIGNQSDLNSIYTFMSFIRNDLVSIINGAALILGLLLIVVACSGIVSSSAYLNIGVACLAAMLYFMDFGFWPGFNNMTSLIVLKKVMMIASQFTCYLFLAGIEKYYFKKRTMSRYLHWLFVLMVLIMLFTKDYLFLRQFTEFANFTLIMYILPIIYYVYKKSDSYLLVPITILLASLIQGFLILILGINARPFFVYGYISTLIGFCFILITDFKILRREVGTSYMKAITDPLTGAYNRRALEELELNNTLIVMVDFNNFKKLNDDFGHSCGDDVLRNFVYITKKNLRESDSVLRMGGDEFLIALKKCMPAAARRIMNRIDFEMKEIYGKNWHGFSWGMKKSSGDFIEAINRADEDMYSLKFKEKGKK